MDLIDLSRARLNIPKDKKQKTNLKNESDGVNFPLSFFIWKNVNQNGQFACLFDVLKDNLFLFQVV